MSLYYIHDGELIEYEDMRSNYHSAKCQPRDIRIIHGEDSAKIREAIAIDTRLGQGLNPIGVAKNLLHE